MMGFGIRLFNGMGVGIEHFDDMEDEGIKWCITMDILCIRLLMFKEMS